MKFMTRSRPIANLQAIPSIEGSGTTPLSSTTVSNPLSGKAINPLELPDSPIVVAILEGLHLLSDLNVLELPTAHFLAQSDLIAVLLPICQFSDAEIQTFANGSITKGCEQIVPVNRDVTLSPSRDKSTRNTNTLIGRSITTKQTLVSLEKVALKLRDLLRKCPLSPRIRLEFSASNASAIHASQTARDSPSAALVSNPKHEDDTNSNEAASENISTSAPDSAIGFHPATQHCTIPHQGKGKLEKDMKIRLNKHLPPLPIDSTPSTTTAEPDIPLPLPQYPRFRSVPFPARLTSTTPRPSCRLEIPILGRVITKTELQLSPTNVALTAERKKRHEQLHRGELDPAPTFRFPGFNYFLKGDMLSAIERVRGRDYGGGGGEERRKSLDECYGVTLASI